MAYNKTNWSNDITPINEDNMNKIEDQLEILTTQLETAQQTISNLQSQVNTLNGYKVDKIFQLLSNDYPCTTTVVKGDNYSSVSGSVYLVAGCMLRVYLNATRSSAANGNITNEKMATFTVTLPNNWIFDNIYNITGVSGSSGACSQIYTSNLSASGSTLTFDLNLAATSTSSTSFNPYMILPCTINFNSVN